MRKIRFYLLSLVVCFCFSLVASAQGGADDVKHKFAPINTAIPSLSIAPDARGGALGDNGVSTTPDVNSQYWNPAKYAFAYSKAGVSPIRLGCASWSTTWLWLIFLVIINWAIATFRRSVPRCAISRWVR